MKFSVEWFSVLPQRAIILVLLCCLVAGGPAACGMRGDLYLPKEPAQAEQPASDASADAAPVKTDTE